MAVVLSISGSLSIICTAAALRARLAPLAFDRLIVKASTASLAESLVKGTLMKPLVSPAAMVSLPPVAVKSLVVAVPATAS